MSQVEGQNTEQVEEDEFNEGFDIDDAPGGNDSNDTGNEQNDLNGDGSDSGDGGSEQPDPQPAPAQQPIPASYVPPVTLPGEHEPVETHVPAQPVVEEQKPKSIEAPEHLKEELEALRKSNPAAADLALEDSPEGEAIRSRLEQYGADLASDKADQVLFRRNQDQAAKSAQAEREIQAIASHNSHFRSVMQRDHPDVYAMGMDKSRAGESAQFMRNITDWIKSKPYAEAAPLMEIANSGRDPIQVSALISQYKSETGVAAKQPDHTGALAVPGRGAPVAPSGIGDKDDFDAGWDINASK